MRSPLPERGKKRRLHRLQSFPRHLRTATDRPANHRSAGESERRPFLVWVLVVFGRVKWTKEEEEEEEEEDDNVAGGRGGSFDRSLKEGGGGGGVFWATKE